MLNNIQILGRLVETPELRSSENGTYIKFTLAVERDAASRDGKKAVDFLPCIAFNKKSEVISKYFCKGSKIMICGRLGTEIYKDKYGKTAKNYIIFTEKIYFAESKPKQMSAACEQTDADFTDDRNVPF